MQISIVSGQYQTDNLKNVDLKYVLDSIKTGSSQKDQITKIRKLVEDGADKSLIRDEKKKLPAIMFNGVFSKRQNEGLVEGSGLMILDFDDDRGDAKGIEELKSYIVAMFSSPSGTGVKVLIRIPKVKNDAEYKTYFYAVQKIVPEVDPSGKDVARLCYFSYDEEIAVKDFDSVKVWEEKIESIPIPQNTFQKKRFIRTNFEHINTAINLISNSMVGNRHDTMLRAGRLMGGYIAGGELDESDVKSILHTHIQAHSPDDYRDHIKAFNDAIEHGKKTPFTKKELKEIDDEVEKLGTIHIELESVIDEMNYRYENGLPRGYKLGWPEIDRHYTMLLGSTTYVYSSAYSGKSQWWNEALVNLSRFYGMRHALFSPETGNAAEVYMELAQIYTKKHFKKSELTPAERDEAYAFLAKHFIVLDGDFFDKDLTVKDVCNYTTMLERKLNQKIHTLTIDPWNELKHNYESRQDLKLEEELKFIRKSAKNNERHICVVTHVRDQEGQTNMEEGFTYYNLPTFRDVAGGQTWSRKGMMMVAVWRPLIVKKGSNTTEAKVSGRIVKDNQLIIQIQKAKPKGYGSPGEVNLYYHVENHTYVDEQGHYAAHPEHQFAVLQDTLISYEETEPF